MLFLKQSASELLAARPTTSARPITRPNLAPSENAFYGKALYRMGRSFVAAYMHLMLDVDIQRHAPLPEGPKILAASGSSSAKRSAATAAGWDSAPPWELASTFFCAACVRTSDLSH
jgi:hypothetical protein